VGYLADSFVVINIINPNAPVITSGIVNSVSLNGPESLAVVGNVVFIGNYNSGGTDAVTSVDVSNVLNPVIMNTISDPNMLNPETTITYQ
jgi:hypothetical protein